MTASYDDEVTESNAKIDTAAWTAKTAVDDMAGRMQNTVRVPADQLKAAIAAQAALNRLHALRFRPPLVGRMFEAAGPVRVVPAEPDFEALMEEDR